MLREDVKVSFSLCLIVLYRKITLRLYIELSVFLQALTFSYCEWTQCLPF